MSLDLNAAARAARFMVSRVATIRALAADGESCGTARRTLFDELNRGYPAARSAIQAVTPDLRRTRTNAVRLGDFVAPTAHELAVKMLYSLNRDWFGVELVGCKRVLHWPDADEVIAEIELEHTRAVALSGGSPPLMSGGDQRPANRPPGPTGSAADESHSDDFRSVRWYGSEYTFTATQAACIRVLWEAWEHGSPVMGQDSILEAAGSDGSRLRDVFNKGKHPAWDTMIVSPRKGAYQLERPA